MSDYLGRLAARSLEPARAVQPRLASRFEPLSPAAPLAGERTAEGSSSLDVTAEDTAVTPARSPRPLAAPRKRIALPEVMDDEPAALPRPRRLRRDPVAEEIEPALERRPISTVALARVPVEIAPVQSPPAHRGILRSEASPPGPLSTGVERGNSVRAEVASSIPFQAQKELSVLPRPALPPSFPLSTIVERGPGGEASERKLADDRQPSKGETLSTILQPKITVIEREPFPSRRETSAPAPTIQVTIGRIEVRATPAPAKPDRPRPSAPSALSLEEYLRGRSKGGAG